MLNALQCPCVDRAFTHKDAPFTHKDEPQTISKPCVCLPVVWRVLLCAYVGEQSPRTALYTTTTRPMV
jgi:hypothetical protein